MQMCRAKCAKCGWVHDVVTAPMPVTDWCKAVEGSCCPMCANSKGNTTAPPLTLTDAEADHKRALIDGCALPATHPYSSAQDPA